LETKKIIVTIFATITPIILQQVLDN
jgi:hypothetical protein